MAIHLTCMYTVADSVLITHYRCWWNKWRLHAGWRHVVAGQGRGTSCFQPRWVGRGFSRSLGLPVFVHSTGPAKVIVLFCACRMPPTTTTLFTAQSSDPDGMCFQVPETLIMRLFFFKLLLLWWSSGAVWMPIPPAVIQRSRGLQRPLPWKRVRQLTLWPLKMFVHFAVTRRRMSGPGNTNGCKAGLNKRVTWFNTACPPPPKTKTR